MSSTTWIAVGIIVAAGAGILTLLKSRMTRKEDFGAVSDQWVAQHRADHTYDH
jgi:hypothetical protein